MLGNCNMVSFYFLICISIQMINYYVEPLHKVNIHAGNY